MDRGSSPPGGRGHVRPLFALCSVALAALAVPAFAQPQNIEEKAALCAACHGENGVPVDPKYPIIWGQYEGYLYIQLRDFKRGNRKNELMQPIIDQLEREDMLALAEYFSKKKWPVLDQPRASAEDAFHAQQVAGSAQCSQCHLGGFMGAGVQPRLAGQSRDYLLKTMRDFRSGARANNDWMTALLQKYTDADIVALANYLAGL